jgi:site-specific DNA recombinase
VNSAAQRTDPEPAPLVHGHLGPVWTVEQTRIERREIQWFVLAAELDNAGIGEL